MKKLLRNRGFRRELAALLAVEAVFIAVGFVMGPVCGVFAVCFALAAAAVFVLGAVKRYRDIGGLADGLDRILHGREDYSLDRFSEGELSILQSELSKLLVTLRRQSEALSSDKKFLAESLADISHQLKTPLTSLNLAAAMLAEPELPADRRQELAREITRGLGRIEWLVSALLKMSRLDAGMAELAKNAFTAGQLVENAAAPLLIALELRDVELDTSGVGSQEITADFAWCSEALGNILKNCMEHTPSGGRITVASRENAIYTQITVADTGPGIAPEDLPHIFERFYRGKNADAQSAGIGLALARKIIVNSGGAVTAENAPGGGALFTLRFYKMAV